MDAITIREEGTDSPNIGTVYLNNDSIFNHTANGVLTARLNRCLVSHYDADVRFMATDEMLERIKSKGDATLEVEVEGDWGDNASYKTILTLERTWLY